MRHRFRRLLFQENRIEKDAIPTLFLAENSNMTAFEESPDEAVDVAQPSTSQDFQSLTATASVQTTQILSATSLALMYCL
ncbi:hypothetical protein QE152_g25708 [Popillia japonica]|uniref:Uncharacterized protein n=1 Tax=Popillia japonica TaxID=7064 RepID=A0AAW1K0R7_POPJA